MTRDERLDYCIHYLMKQTEAKGEIPKDLHGKQMMLRTLMNVWRPQSLDIEFLQLQDAELRKQMKEKGAIRPRGWLWRGDITRLQVDAIVNAATPRGLGCWNPMHPCIDNDIHSAAGLQLRQECNRILQGDEIATGSAIITPGYNLPARFVIHTVGPVIGNGTPSEGQEEQLACCYRTCLWLAREQGCRSIAFCCISTGESHFPNRRAAEIAVNVCREAHIHVVFCVGEDSDYETYRQLLGRR